MGKFQNEQERLIALFSKHSMGTPFIFSPEEYQKGKAIREPADLVWSCGNCIVLFYAYKTEKSGINKAIEHNLKQAKGWLRAWKDLDISLKGKNEFQEFNIGFGEHKHIIVLSIIECPQAMAVYHLHEAQNLDISVCVTLPFSVLEKMVELYVGLPDFILLLTDLKESNTLSEKEMLTRIASYKNEMEIVTGFAVAPNHFKNHSEFVKFLIRGLKLNQSLPLIGISQIFNDLLLLDQYKMILEYHRAREKIRQVKNETEESACICQISLTNYEMVFALIPFLPTKPEALEAFDKGHMDFVESIQLRNKNPIISWVTSTDFRVNMFVLLNDFDKRVNSMETLTEKMLDVLIK